MEHIKNTHIYKQTDAYAIELDAYLPKKTSDHVPVVMHIHGGALISGGREYADNTEITAVTDAGMAYVTVDYRLARETKLMEISRDIEDALTWIRGKVAELYGFDKNRVAVMGHSAGGYLALLSGTFPNRPNAIVSFYGYGDITGDWYARPCPHYLKSPLVSPEEAEGCITKGIPTGGKMNRTPIYLRARQTGTWASLVSGLHPSHVSKALLPYCPIKNIDALYPPTMLLHGSADTDVPAEQSITMHEN